MAENQTHGLNVVCSTDKVYILNAMQVALDKSIYQMQKCKCK